MTTHAYLFGLEHRPVRIHSEPDEDRKVLVELLWAQKQGEDRVYSEEALSDRPVPSGFWYGISWV